jgi:hypothetical protein
MLLLRPAWNHDPPTSTSQVAGIIIVHQHVQLEICFFVTEKPELVMRAQEPPNLLYWSLGCGLD